MVDIVTKCAECTHAETCKYESKFIALKKDLDNLSGEWLNVQFRCKHFSQSIEPVKAEPSTEESLCDTCANWDDLYMCPYGHDPRYPKPTTYCHSYLKRHSMETT